MAPATAPANGATFATPRPRAGALPLVAAGATGGLPALAFAAAWLSGDAIARSRSTAIGESHGGWFDRVATGEGTSQQTR